MAQAGKSSRSRAAVGRRNRQAGKELERRVATDLRQILDPPHVSKAISEAQGLLKGYPSKATRSTATSEIKRLQKLSSVRRGEQGRGAHEPDIVTATDWWIEVSRRADVSPFGKLAQAERDVGAAIVAGQDSWTRPVAVWRRTGSPVVLVALRLVHLAGVAGDDAEVLLDGSPVSDVPVMVEYEWFLKVIRLEYGTH